MDFEYYYKAKIVDVYDGDTVTAEIDLGFNVKFKEKLRLFGINAPELRGEEREKGLVSRDYLRGLILDKTVTIKTIKDKKGKYGRYLATIIVDGLNINSEMVFEGYAINKKY